MTTARFFPFVGGTESHVYEAGRRLVRAGVDVTILTTDPTRRLPRAEECEGMQIRRVPAFPSQRDYYFAPGVYRAIVRGSWDIVHCQGVHTLVAPLAMLAARRARIPYVVTFHTGGHSSGWRNALRGMQWRALRPLLARAARLIGVSQFEIDRFRKTLSLPSERFTLIPNGSHLPTPAREGQLPVQRDLILSVGRLERYKGHQHMIAALPQVLERRPDARLVIVGTGPYESELRRIARAARVGERVEFRAIPASNREEMASLLAQAALVVLFSEYEAHPVAVMEALALGRPVLVADTSGLHELAERGLVCALALDSQPGEIASAVVAQLRAPIASAQVQLPTWDDCANELYQLYQEIIGVNSAAYSKPGLN